MQSKERVLATDEAATKTEDWGSMEDPKFLKNGGGRRKTIYQLRPHLSQMRATKYMPFTRKKAVFFIKKYEPIGEGRPVRIGVCYLLLALYFLTTPILTT